MDVCQHVPFYPSSLSYDIEADALQMLTACRTLNKK